MATPTISTVTPGEGHSGGGTVVEIVGTNFRLPTAPAPTGKTTPPPPSVRVRFGTWTATDVAVYSTALLYCRTPPGDELAVETAWTVDPSTDTFTAAAHGLPNGTPVRLVATSGPLPAPFDSGAVFYVRDTALNTFKLALSVGGAAVDATVAGGGKAVSVGPYSVTVENIDDAGAVIPSETATKTAAFTFRRPNLSTEGHLAQVVRTLLRLLKRTIIENVHFATHTDYDAETGDLLSLAFCQRLPALVLANLETPDDRDYHVEGEEDFDAGSGRFIGRRPPAVVMVRFDLIGVSDDPVELLNLYQATRLVFRKTTRLLVDRDPADLSLGQVGYDLEFSFSGPVSVTHQGSNTNVESFSAQVRVRGVRLEDIPGVSTSKPAGIPARFPHEATTSFGHVSADDATAVAFDTQRKPDEP